MVAFMPGGQPGSALADRHLTLDPPDRKQERPHQPQHKRQGHQPPIYVMHHRAPISRAPGRAAMASALFLGLIETTVISQAISEPTAKASRYHNHWMTKSMTILLN